MLGLFGAVLRATGHMLALTGLSLFGALSLFMMTPCCFWQDMRED